MTNRQPFAMDFQAQPSSDTPTSPWTEAYHNAAHLLDMDHAHQDPSASARDAEIQPTLDALTDIYNRGS